MFLAHKDYHIHTAQEKLAKKELRKNVIIKGEVKRALQYSLSIPMISYGSVESSKKSSLSEKTPQKMDTSI